MTLHSRRIPDLGGRMGTKREWRDLKERFKMAMTANDVRMGGGTSVMCLATGTWHCFVVI